MESSEFVKSLRDSQIHNSFTLDDTMTAFRFLEIEITLLAVFALTQIVSVVPGSKADIAKSYSEILCIALLALFVLLGLILPAKQK